MTPVLYIAAALAVLAFSYFVVPKLVKAYSRYRAKMVLTCPETRNPVAVKVDLKRAALGELMGKPDIKLTGCTRWPERQECDQECVLQIEVAPEDCIAKTILANWYSGKNCILCGKHFGEIRWLEPKPALLDPISGTTIECLDVPFEQLPSLLATHKPVCSNCHTAEAFRRIDPEMVVDRPWQQGGPWHA